MIKKAELLIKIKKLENKVKKLTNKVGELEANNEFLFNENQVLKSKLRSDKNDKGR